MLNLLRDHEVETEYPIGVVNWTKYVVLKCSTQLIGSQFVDTVQRGGREVSNVHELIRRLGRRNPT